MILLLSDDIHLHPGPPVQINFAHLNIFSASSVTAAQLNKPVALAQFISDHDIEILSLSLSLSRSLSLRLGCLLMQYRRLLLHSLL